MTMQSEIRPFRIDIPQADLDDLRQRIGATRWPGDPAGPGWARGIPGDALRSLAEFWADGYDWRAEEARLNEIPQFVTEIDGQDIHFLHVRSPEPHALPLVLTHGYPSSIVEFLDLIGPLSDPRSHGADPADAFHVVVPSLPGFAFSTPLAQAGWPMARVARAWAELMRRLGYARYGTHGGDIGSGIAGMLAGVDAASVAGVHIVSDPRSVAAVVGEFVPVDLTVLSEDERQHLERLQSAAAEGKGYLQLQSTKPQSLAYALNDSPAFQLGWIAEPFHEWTEPRPDRPHGVDRDRLLTNVSLYWFTQSGSTAAHMLYDNAHSQEWVPSGEVPQGWAVFSADPLVRKLMDPGHTTSHWTEFERGGHFPALEVPDLLVDDLRVFFRKLR